MLSILESSVNLKERDCDLEHKTTDNRIIPSNAELLYSDEMTRSVPSIRSQSSQEFEDNSTSFTSCRRNSRKGRPNRSCSWQDAAPGIVFKFNDDSQTILVIPNNISTRDLSKITFFDKSSTERKRSQSITAFGDQIPLMTSRSRPRSFSVDFTSLSSTSYFSSAKTSSTDNSVLEVNEEETVSDEAGKEGRKSSVSSVGSSSSSSQKKRSNSVVNSLSHLVPNKLLSTISRRISASSAHELCRCSSCNQSVTPYWRDGWADDVMLCNACGLRFQKFAQRCMYCKYIPRKEDGVEDTCPQCRAPWEC